MCMFVSSPEEYLNFYNTAELMFGVGRDQRSRLEVERKTTGDRISPEFIVLVVNFIDAAFEDPL